MSSDHAYVTASIPYVNAEPHLGHIMEFIEADTIARWYKQQGKKVRSMSGSDEHALKIVQKAEEAQEPIEQYCARHAKIFEQLAKDLHVEFDAFLRTSDPTHHKSSQELWRLCEQAGDIYLKEYTGMYCVGCEQFYGPEELDENGECWEHPGKPLEKVSESNYFFRLSKYKDQLIELIESNIVQILPESRKNETLKFLRGDVHDFSISRTIERTKGWGVPVPDDDKQVMYVWFDALNLYQTGAGFTQDEQQYHSWWPADWHVIGKGILRFHTVYWPAMLLSANLQLPKRVAVHGYLTLNGQKMSKSLGNVIDPRMLLDRYGADGLRYLLLAEVSTFEDSDVSVDRFDESYNAKLANGVGNLCARITTLAEKLEIRSDELDFSDQTQENTLSDRDSEIERFNLHGAIQRVMQTAAELDRKISEQKPWAMEPSAQRACIIEYLQTLQLIATGLQPFLPVTAERILSIFETEMIHKLSGLFPRLDSHADSGSGSQPGSSRT